MKQPEHKRLHAPERRIAIWGPLIVVTALAILIVAGAWRHVQEKREQREYAKQAGITAVNFIVARRDGAPHDLTLPGSVQAFTQAQLYARVNGYLARWLVDIGDTVKEGQLLAEIESPDVDAQLRQAAANQAQARANLEIARITYTREQELAAKQVVSRQEFDQSRTAYEAARAALEAGEANVQNLRVQQNFEKIVAPFAGRITTRLVDIGALVSQGSGSTGTPLFGIAQTDPLRIYVNVPQANYPSIRADVPARLIVPEFPGRSFKGKVARYSAAIDPASRTLLTEVDISNPDGVLNAGMYGEIKFTLVDANAPILIPSDALVFQSKGPEVVTITSGGLIHRQPVQVGRDFGKSMEIVDGLKENARIVVNPSDDLTEGLHVQARPQEKEAAASGSPQPTGAPSKSKG